MKLMIENEGEDEEHGGVDKRLIIMVIFFKFYLWRKMFELSQLKDKLERQKERLIWILDNHM